MIETVLYIFLAKGIFHYFSAEKVLKITQSNILQPHENTVSNVNGPYIFFFFLFLQDLKMQNNYAANIEYLLVWIYYRPYLLMHGRSYQFMEMRSGMK